MNFVIDSCLGHINLIGGGKLDNPNADRPPNVEKLYHIPVFAVRALLSQLIVEPVGLQNKTGDELVELAAQTPQVTQAAIDDLYEEYRYGGRASFFLYLLDSTHEREQMPSVEEWNTALDNLFSDDDTGAPLGVEISDIESLELGLTEIRFTYEKQHEFIDPISEDYSSISELHFGFAWLNLRFGYLVLMSKFEDVNVVIEHLVARVIGTPPMPIRLTNHFINIHFAVEHIRSAGWFEPSTGVRRRVSGEEMYDVAGEEVNRNDHRSERTTSLYDEPVSDEIRSRLGISLRKGKLYLTKTIRASELREWMYNRLHVVLLALRDLNAEEYVTAVAAPIPPHYGLRTQRAQDHFRYIVSAILGKQRDHTFIAWLPFGDFDLYSSLREFFVEPEAYFECEECGEASVICCPNCDSDQLRVSRSTLKCRNCETEISGRTVEVRCLRGHSIAYPYSEVKLLLRPNSRLQQIVSNYADITGLGAYNPDEEFFTIEGSELSYVRNDVQAVYLPDDLAEFAGLHGREALSPDLWIMAGQLVQTLKEKCAILEAGNARQPRRLDCEECFQQNLARLCIPKLFRAMRADFMPLPHGGYEFGDVGLRVTISGEPYVFIGIAKSKRGHLPIASNTTHGKEIVNQVLSQVLRDQRVQAFGIIAHAPLAEELRSTVVLLARMAGKKVVFWGEDELIRLCANLLNSPEHQSLLNLVQPH